MFKITKLTDKKSLAVDSLTGDPVAYIHKAPQRWSRNKFDYATEWHPAMKELYPETEKSFHYMGGVEDADSMSSASNRLESLYHSLVNNAHKEPLQYERADSITKPFNGNEAVKFHVHKLFHEGNHVANLFSINLSNKGSDADHVEYVGDSPTKEQHSILEKKGFGKGPFGHMKRVEYFQQLKNEKPSFVGSHSNDGRAHVYKTHHTPEDASRRFEQHLHSTLPNTYNSHEVTTTRFTPTTFVTTHIHGSGNKDTHFVDTSNPGTVHHIIGKVNAEKYVSKALSTVIQ